MHGHMDVKVVQSKHNNILLNNVKFAATCFGYR